MTHLTQHILHSLQLARDVLACAPVASYHLCRLQLSKLREKLEAIARELEVANKETFLSSFATERAAELASSKLSKPSDAAKPKLEDTERKTEPHGKLKPKDKKPQQQMQPNHELEDAEKKPKLFEPVAGPPPRVGEEELAAEGSGQEILLQVGLDLA